MAILDVLPGVEIMVCVDDEPLAEIDTENDEIEHPDPSVIEHQIRRTTTKYIRSTTGKKYTIRIKASRPYDLKGTALIFNVEVDGKFIKAPLLLQEDYEDMSWEDEVEGSIIFNGDDAIVRRLRFAAVKTTSAQLHSKTVEKQKKVLKSVGLIEVGIYRATCNGHKFQRSATEEYELERKIDFERPYHMKAIVKENISHGSCLADAEPAGEEKMFTTEKIDGDDYPLGVFKFKYRSKKNLKELGVIPRTPSPEPSPAPLHTQVPTPAATPAQEATPTLVASVVASGTIPSLNPQPTSSAFQIEFTALIERHRRELDETIRKAVICGSITPELASNIKLEAIPAQGVKRDPEDSEAPGESKTRKKPKRQCTRDLSNKNKEDHTVVIIDD